jgi:hypothetical protein
MGEALAAGSPLFGRESELRMLEQLFDNLHDRGCALGLTGGPGIGKSALLAEAAERAAERGMLVLRATGVQSEAMQAFAGLHQLLRPVLSYLDGLPTPQRDAIQAAFGLAEGYTPDLFLTALAALDLLADSAARAPVLVVADDAQWLDRPTRDVLAFVARRLEFEPVMLITAVLDGYPGPLDAWQRAVHLGALPSAAAAALLDARAPGLPAAVRGRLLDEAAGNPLALVELPGGLGKAATVPRWLPLTSRLEQAFAARAFDLPGPTRTALLVAALNDGPLLSEVLEATSLLIGKVSPFDVLAPAVNARLIESDGTSVSFRHPLIRTAMRQEASMSQRHAAHSALASVLTAQPERQVWHRAASITGPDEAVAGELEAAAAQAERRGGTAVAVAALQRAADLGDGPQRPGRLLRTAELAFELGQHDLVRNLLGQAEPLGLSSREQARLAWVRESFGDGVPGAAANARLLAAAADQASAEGDTGLALKLLNGAAQRCWWAEPGEAARDHVVATAERLDIAESDPRLLVILAFAAPVERGAVVIGRLSQLLSTAEPGTGAVRLAAIAATAVGAFDLAAALLAASVASLRAQGRLGLLARALALQAWSAAQLADLGTAIPVAEEARRLAEETTQPLIMTTAEAAGDARRATRPVRGR